MIGEFSQAHESSTKDKKQERVSGKKAAEFHVKVMLNAGAWIICISKRNHQMSIAKWNMEIR